MSTRFQMCVALCMAVAACRSNARPPDTAVGMTVRGANADAPGIVFRNEMSGSFRLTRALFVLDNVVLFNAQSTRDESLPSEIPLVAGRVPPGDHVFKVLLRFRGHGEGAFSYLRGYKFEVKSRRTFTVKDDQALRLEAIAWERGGSRTPLEERPSLRYAEAVKSIAIESENNVAASRPWLIWHEVPAERWAASLYGYQPAVKVRFKNRLGSAVKSFTRYITAMHERLHARFADSFLAALGGVPARHPLNGPELHSVLEIALDQHGRIARMGVIEGSGVTAFDIAALESTHAAAPFGKPPDEIVSADGLVYVHWEFWRNPYYSCSTYFVRPYLLRAPPPATP